MRVSSAFLVISIPDSQPNNNRSTATYVPTCKPVHAKALAAHNHTRVSSAFLVISIPDSQPKNNRSAPTDVPTCKPVHAKALTAHIHTRASSASFVGNARCNKPSWAAPCATRPLTQCHVRQDLLRSAMCDKPLPQLTLMCSISVRLPSVCVSHVASHTHTHTHTHAHTHAHAHTCTHARTQI